MLLRARGACRLLSGCAAHAWHAPVACMPLINSVRIEPQHLQSQFSWQSPSYSSQSEQDAGKGSTRHPHFPNLTNASIQARFEDAEVEKAQDGLMNSTWTVLYETPAQSWVKQVLLRPLANLRQWVLSPMLNRVSSVAAEMVENEVEGAFETEEFLEGASVAVRTVMDLFSRRDWEAVREVCSHKLQERLKIALVELEAQGIQLQSVSVQQVHATRLFSTNLWTADNIGKFDEKWQQAVTDSASGSWLVCAVWVDVTLQAVHADSRTGEQLQTQELRKQGVWLLTRGPLPKGFVSQLTQPWCVLAWWG